MNVNVYAKLNLALSVGAKQGRFHPIDSLVTSVDVCDFVSVVSNSDDNIVLRCNAKIVTQANCAYKAAVEFCREFGTHSVEIFVQKGIPIGAGMGGSSADAAAVVYCMCKLFGVDVLSDRVHALCANLGSDVNFMLRGGFARMRGKGDEVTFAPLAQPIYFALTLFDAQLGSADVYSAFDNVAQKPTLCNGGAMEECFKALSGDSTHYGGKTEHAFAMDSPLFHNDLQVAAQRLSYYASRYVAFARQCGWHSCMTGSGSAYFVPFEQRSPAEQAVARLNENGFKTLLCTSVSQGIRVVD